MPLSVDVAVVAFNRYDLTRSCLEHLARQTRAHTVLLCDDGSTDGTAERVAAEWPDVRLVRSDENRGFARATNAAVRAGTGDVVVLLNNDVDCRPELLARLVEPLERDPGIGSAAALMLRPDGATIDSIGLTADPTLSGFPRLQGQPATSAGSATPLLCGPAGTAGAFRRVAWDAVGGLDERIFAYMEDLDLCLRLRSAGWRTAAVPQAVGIHLGSGTFGHRTAWQRRQGGFSRGYLMRRYGLLRRRNAARTLLTEAVAVTGDALAGRDLAALRGRLAGWRAAARLEPHAFPPAAALESRIGLRAAFALRAGVYRRR